MIADLKPYPAMKDSGVPWLDAIPEHWEIRRLKYVLRERDARSASGSEQLLRVSQFTGVTERKSNDGTNAPDTRAASLEGYKLVSPNDLVINIMLAWNGSMGVSRFDGIASPAYCVYRFGREAHPWYFHYLLRSPIYKARIKAVSTGVVDSRLRLYTESLYRLDGLLPTLDEQATIVRFLNHADRRIRHYIGAKQQLIELLEEQEQVTIHEAVTRGLDPNVSFKPSGVEWLGDVPEHWDVRKLGSLFKLTGSGTTPNGDTYYGVDVPWVMTGDLNNGVVESTKRSVTLAAVNELGALKRYPRGALVIAMYGATIGKTGLLAMAACTNQACCVLASPRIVTEVEYMQCVMNVARPSLVERGKGGGQPNVNAETVRGFRVPCPPVSEQRAIVASLQAATAPSRAAVSAAESELQLLRELRARLIADVVTGKLDVREAAAGLPDELEQIDEADLEEVVDDELADDLDAELEEVEA